MSLAVSLDNCAREPIHIPGSIQPHGLLFSCRGRELLVRQASANVESWLGVTAEALAGRPFTTLLAEESAAELDTAVQRPSLREVSPLRLRMSSGVELEATLHRSGDAVIIELENSPPSMTMGPRGFDPRLRASMLRMQAAADVTALCQVAAEEVRLVTGYDRVMVYRFDQDWNGSVVAEQKRDDLEPFLGLHYPAADIPEQARRLYTINWLRMIGDIGYRPVPLIPELDPDHQRALDLSHAVLRSVSPIHVEYLTNMGVTASMSVSMVVDGVLAGLIACHHYSGPRLVDRDARDTCEFLGQALSWQLAVLEREQLSQRARAAREAEAAVVHSIVSSREFLDGLATPSLLPLADAAGAAVVLTEGVRRIGETPSADGLAALVGWLKQQPSDVVALDHLSRALPSAASWDVAGVLAVAISRELGEYVVWFRPATERTIDWAGDPRKAVVPGPPGEPPRLSPRGSFALWRETVRGRSLPWEAWQVEAASNLRRALLGGIRRRAAELRVLNDRLLETDRAKDAFIAAVSHELRTPLNAITGWTQMLRSNSLPEGKVDHALAVIARNADAQQHLIDDLLDVSRITSGKVSLQIEPIDLPALVASVVDSAAVAVQNKHLRVKQVLDPEAAPILADTGRLRQIVGNLLNNAIKFTPKGGSILVTVRRLSSDVEIAIKDSGQGIPANFLPHVFEPFRQQDAGLARRSGGLGLGLAIVRKLVELHGGRVSAESEGEGLGSTFRVELPLAPLRTSTPPDSRAAEVATPGCPPELEGLRVLIVEDETDARDLLAIVLTQCGARVTRAANAFEALDAIRRDPFDLIVSDIGLPEMDGMQLMQAVRELPAPARSIPAIALSAHTRAIDRTRALKAGFQAHVAKPVDLAELTTVAASLVGRLTPV